MSEQANEAKCPREVSDTSGWHWHKCGRPIKRNGLCGIHASADERRERNKAEGLIEARERNRQAEEKRVRESEMIAADAAVKRVWALLDGAPMVTQADVQRALEGTNPPAPEASAGVGDGVGS